ncbi:MAG: response regulator [bacterium]
MTKILFVEDEPWGVNAYFSHLARHDCQCVLAKDFDEAMAKLRADQYDVLSLDIMFSPGEKNLSNVEPRSAGLRLLELIRRGEIPNCDPNLKIIVLTAVLNKQVEEKIKTLGVAAYLKKPIAFKKVIDTLKSMRQRAY